MDFNETGVENFFWLVLVNKVTDLRVPKKVIT
jgi:hypothetical protein